VSGDLATRGWTTVARADLGADEPATPVPGFLNSDFAALIRTVAHACVGPPDGSHRLVGLGDDTALVLASIWFDIDSLERAAELVRSGKPVHPLLFHQTVPTPALGVVARDYGITGPVWCVAANGDPLAEALASTEPLLAGGEVRAVLVLAVEIAGRGLTRMASGRLLRPGWEDR